MAEFIAEAWKYLERLPAEIMRSAFVIAIAGLVFLVLYRLTNHVQRRTHHVMARRHPQGGETLARAAARIVWIAGVVAAILAALSILGVDLAALMAALGLSTVVLGFAFKDIIEQAITGTLLLIQRPFRVGDVIQVEGVEGTVMDVAIRTTNLMTLDGIHALIPNNKIYQSIIRNKSYYPARRLALIFGLGPNCELPVAHRALLAAVAQVPGILADPAPVVAFQGWEQDAVRTHVQFWIDKAGDGLATETAVTQAILDTARHTGLDVRSPVQTLVMR